MSDGKVMQSCTVSRAGFGPGSGQVRARFGLKVGKNFGLISGLSGAFFLDAQKYNQNNLAASLNFSDPP